ncbi:Probable methyltransferase [hydrothermal vent metagenome]|uniref:Probable methyltransferase n=1 Tax=hydrothermal vent metagenome TaxID=652676 RepID=A0A3B1DUB6_9ZZZZ
MDSLVEFNYINQKDKSLVKIFTSSNTTIKRYILGINKFTKSILKHIQVDGVIDDFTRIQSSNKKDILNIKDIPKNSIILWVSMGSPLEVKNELDKMKFKNISYLALYRYSSFDLIEPPFITDFENDFKKNITSYKQIYNLLEDTLSKKIFIKILNFKISFDYTFMEGFVNDHDKQYFDKHIIKNIKNITFLDGGAYTGDTTPQVITRFPDFKKIFLIEPSLLHINIAKRNLKHISNLEFINCGLGANKMIIDESELIKNNCDHNYQTKNIDTIDNIINENIDFIKLDIEGAEQDAIDGAKHTILKYKPILAICIYHKAQDWYKIPQKILLINKDYKVYIRHYMEGIYETVMYFIPKRY